MIVGFTGTRQGMTDAQMRSVEKLLAGWDKNRRKGERSILHHGDCIGADEEAHFVASANGYGLVVHPPNNPHHRAFAARKLPDAVLRVMPEEGYLERNFTIIRASDVILATPRWRRGEEPTSPKGEGTWHAMRHGRAHGLRVVVVYPDGEVGEYRG